LHAKQTASSGQQNDDSGEGMDGRCSISRATVLSVISWT